MTELSANKAKAYRTAEVRIQTVHWNGTGRVALIGEIDMSNVADADRKRRGQFRARLESNYATVACAVWPS